MEIDESSHPTVKAGWAVQLAWIAAHERKPAEATEHLGGVEADWLPANYRAELHFTRAATHLAAGEPAAAAKALDEARGLLRRGSSARNLLFLEARVAAARQDWALAEKLCREAASHPYKCQGGDGLLLWAKALGELGRPEEAAQARLLVLERDPESESANVARA
jgi:tetratricopeptide (TPR) repeat protein